MEKRKGKLIGEAWVMNTDAYTAGSGFHKAYREQQSLAYAYNYTLTDIGAKEISMRWNGVSVCVPLDTPAEEAWNLYRIGSKILRAKEELVELAKEHALLLKRIKKAY